MKKPRDKHKIILASKSPRRKAILAQIGINFISIESNFQEKKSPKNSTVLEVKKLVVENAKGKALDVAQAIEGGIVLGVDTLVLYGKQIIGKPADKKDAAKILKKLSGKMHLVFSGIAILQKEKGQIKTAADCEVTKVYFRKLSDKEIEVYVKSGEPLDKAGGYGIQEKGAILIERIEGDFYNVVGLPVAKLLELAKQEKIRL